MSLYQKIREFILRHDMLETRFGRLSVNDPRFIGDLKRGREPRPATVERIEKFMADYDAGIRA